MSHLYTTEHMCCDKGKAVHMHTMKMCWGNCGVGPLVFTDTVLEHGLHMAYSNNEPLQGFFF